MQSAAFRVAEVVAFVIRNQIDYRSVRQSRRLID